VLFAIREIVAYSVEALQKEEINDEGTRVQVVHLSVHGVI